MTNRGYLGVVRLRHTDRLGGTWGDTDLVFELHFVRIVKFMILVCISSFRGLIKRVSQGSFTNLFDSKMAIRTIGVVGVDGVPGTLAKSEEREEKSNAGGEEATDMVFRDIKRYDTL